MGAVRKGKWISAPRICTKKARPGGLGIGICPTHSEIDLLCKSVKYALRRVKQASPVKYFLRKCECKMDFRFWRKSIFLFQSSRRDTSTGRRPISHCASNISHFPKEIYHFPARENNTGGCENPFSQPPYGVGSFISLHFSDTGSSAPSAAAPGR